MQYFTMKKKGIIDIKHQLESEKGKENYIMFKLKVSYIHIFKRSCNLLAKLIEKDASI